MKRAVSACGAALRSLRSTTRRLTKPSPTAPHLPGGSLGTTSLPFQPRVWPGNHKPQPGTPPPQLRSTENDGNYGRGPPPASRPAAGAAPAAGEEPRGADPSRAERLRAVLSRSQPIPAQPHAASPGSGSPGAPRASPGAPRHGGRRPARRWRGTSWAGSSCCGLQVGGGRPRGLPEGFWGRLWGGEISSASGLGAIGGTCPPLSRPRSAVQERGVGAALPCPGSVGLGSGLGSGPGLWGGGARPFVSPGPRCPPGTAPRAGGSTAALRGGEGQGLS